jgi:Caleosin related protein
MAAIRYRDEQTRQHYLVDRDQVYKAKDDQVSLADRIADAEAARFVAARERYFSRHPDGLFGVVHDQLSPRGPLKTAEHDRFTRGERVTASRSDLAGHMDFFDRDNDGWIGFTEGWESWQALGYDKGEAYGKQRGVVLAFFLLLRLKSPIKLIANFTQVVRVIRLLRRPTGDAHAAEHFPSIEVDRIARPSGSTGVYGADGNIDEAKYATFIEPFVAAARDGLVEETAALQILAETKLGRVPKGQFATLFEVTRRMNQAPRVTIDQLRWVFDGSLAHRH